jgi:conjugal transfer/entry exclusion protein
MSDETIGDVLDAVGALAGELDEIKQDVKEIVEHGGDIDALKADVLRIDAHLVRIDEILAGPPTLENLAVKQEKDRKTAARETSDAGTKQEGVNAGFREKFSELFSSVNLLQGASLKLQASVMLVGAIAIYVLARALGA